MLNNRLFKIFGLCVITITLVACDKGNNINSPTMSPKPKLLETNVKIAETKPKESLTNNTEAEKTSRNSSSKEAEAFFDNSEMPNYKISPLKIKLKLKDGWSIKREKAKPTDFASSGLAHYSIYDKEGNLRMGMSYLNYEKEYDDIPDVIQRQQAYYSGIRLGASYFCIIANPEQEKEFSAKPEILHDTAEQETILCKFYNANRKLSGKVEKDSEIDINPGAIIRYKQKQLYLIIEAEKNLEDNILRELVDSIKLA